MTNSANKNYITFKNNEAINIDDIPIVNFESLRGQLIATDLRPVGFFGCKLNENSSKKTRLFAILADDEKGEFMLSSTEFDKNIKEYNSITPENPKYHMFEREFYEQFNICPKNHPWLKPVRKNLQDYIFFEMEGDETHEVAVGPIHAGVIEPGHFRFLCQGEKVYNLEIMLGYQHRGVEDLMIKTPSNQLAESIAGDTVIGHNLAYSELIETLADIKISKKAQVIRKIALEMERIAIHIGDMGAILGDIAYLMGKEVYGVTRTLVINSLLEISGSRFGRGLITLGGVNYDIKPDMIEKLNATLDYVKATIEKMTRAALENSTVMSRLEKTGTVSFETAQSLNMVGLIGRSAGIELDSRFDFFDEIYHQISLDIGGPKKFHATNDAYSRFKIRYKETNESILFIKKMLEILQSSLDDKLLDDTNSNNINNLSLKPNCFALSITEGWRGEIVHIALTDNFGKLIRYKIKDPSFNNWTGLQMALRGNGISDFPLCNKGFDLSYCGFDL